MMFKSTNRRYVFRYLFCAVFLLMVLASSVGAIQSIKDSRDSFFGLDDTAKTTGFKTSSAPDIAVFVGQAVGAVLSLLGVMFMVLIIYAGFMWMNARGNEEDVQKAKDTMINAVIGVVIVFASYTISGYIIDSIYEVTSKIGA